MSSYQHKNRLVCWQSGSYAFLSQHWVNILRHLLTEICKVYNNCIDLYALVSGWMVRRICYRGVRWIMYARSGDQLVVDRNLGNPRWHEVQVGGSSPPLLTMLGSSQMNLGRYRASLREIDKKPVHSQVAEWLPSKLRWVLKDIMC